MKWQATLVLISFCTLAPIADAQSSMRDQGHAQGTQARGYWVDLSTELMWAGKDNGKDVSWKKAMKYCRDLRLAGYSDWRLANMAELQGTYDSTANAPGLAGPPKKLRDFTFHVKGNLFLTGDQWAATPGWMIADAGLGMRTTSTSTQVNRMMIKAATPTASEPCVCALLENDLDR